MAGVTNKIVLPFLLLLFGLSGSAYLSAKTAPFQLLYFQPGGGNGDDRDGGGDAGNDPPTNSGEWSLKSEENNVLGHSADNITDVKLTRPDSSGRIMAIYIKEQFLYAQLFTLSTGAVVLDWDKDGSDDVTTGEGIKISTKPVASLQAGQRRVFEVVDSTRRIITIVWLSLDTLTGKYSLRAATNLSLNDDGIYPPVFDEAVLDDSSDVARFSIPSSRVATSSFASGHGPVLWCVYQSSNNEINVVGYKLLSKKRFSKETIFFGNTYFRPLISDVFRRVNDKVMHVVAGIRFDDQSKSVIELKGLILEDMDLLWSQELDGTVLTGNNFSEILERDTYSITATEVRENRTKNQADGSDTFSAVIVAAEGPDKKIWLQGIGTSDTGNTIREKFPSTPFMLDMDNTIQSNLSISSASAFENDVFVGPDGAQFWVGYKEEGSSGSYSSAQRIRWFIPETGSMKLEIDSASGGGFRVTGSNTVVDTFIRGVDRLEGSGGITTKVDYDAIVTWQEQSANGSGMSIKSARVGSDGDIIWNATVSNATNSSNVLSTKLLSTSSSSIYNIISWSDDRKGSFDVYGAQLSRDGILGTIPLTLGLRHIQKPPAIEVTMETDPYVKQQLFSFFLIKRKNKVTDETITITPSQHTFMDTKIEENTQYEYTVRLVTNGGGTTNERKHSIKTPKLFTPSSISLSKGDLGLIGLLSVVIEVSYDGKRGKTILLERRKEGEEFKQVAKFAPGTTYTDTEIEEALYTYRAAAMDNQGNISDFITGSIDFTPVEGPADEDGSQGSSAGILSQSTGSGAGGSLSSRCYTATASFRNTSNVSHLLFVSFRRILSNNIPGETSSLLYSVTAPSVAGALTENNVTGLKYVLVKPLGSLLLSTIPAWCALIFLLLVLFPGDKTRTKTIF